jgi:hypothetical protein
MQQPDLRKELVESDLIRFEEGVSAPRAAESARFLPLLLAAGIVGGSGGRVCVMGVEAGARQDKARRTPLALAADCAARISGCPFCGCASTCGHNDRTETE